MDKQLEHVLKGLRMTRRNESICLQGWQTEMLVKYIDELERKVKEHEQTDAGRNPEGGC